MKLKRILPIILILSVLAVGCGKKQDEQPAETQTDEIIDMDSVVDEQTDIQEEETETQTDDDSSNSKVDMPGYDYYIADDKSESGTEMVGLTQLTVKANEITDQDNWFKNNDLTINKCGLATGKDGITIEIPGLIDSEYEGVPLVDVCYNDNYYFAIYGNDNSEGYILNLYDISSMELKYSLDFSDYQYGDEYEQSDYDFIKERIHWADTVDNMLYVSIFHSTYSKSCKQTGYIVAIDLTDKSVAWKSEPLTCNSDNFEIVGDSIICGYGFTEESDYIYELDRITGKRTAKMPIKSMAQYIIAKDDTLYVRTYDSDYTFSIDH